MPILLAVLLSLSIPASLLAASDPEDMTKLLEEADRALAEPKSPEKAPSFAKPSSTPTEEEAAPPVEPAEPVASEPVAEPVAPSDTPPGYSESTPPAESVAPEAAGNDVPEAPKPPPQMTKYKVWIWQESGDTLWRIAQKVYGDKDKWRLIYLANKDVIKDPNKIYPKQRLKIPPADWQP